MGCILVEMLTLKPLFPGKGEMDQLNQVARPAHACHALAPTACCSPRDLLQTGTTDIQDAWSTKRRGEAAATREVLS